MLLKDNSGQIYNILNNDDLIEIIRDKLGTEFSDAIENYIEEEIENREAIREQEIAEENKE